MEEMGQGVDEVDNKAASDIALETSGIVEAAEPSAWEGGIMCNKLGPDVIRKEWLGSIEEGRDDTGMDGDDVAEEGPPRSNEESEKSSAILYVNRNGMFNQSSFVVLSWYFIIIFV